jgi:hypothetical protein
MERKRDTGARMDDLIRRPVSALSGTGDEFNASPDNTAAEEKPLFPAAS